MPHLPALPDLSGFTLTSEPSLRVIMLGLAVFGAVWGFVRGIGRLLLSAVALAAGGGAAWAFFRYAPGPLISWLNGFHAAAVNWGAIFCGVVAFLFVQRFLVSFFRGGGAAPAGTGSRLRHGAFGLVPALVLLWGAAMAVRWTGAVSRLRWVEAAVVAGRPSALIERPLLVRLQHGMSTGMLGSVLDRVDPLDSPMAARLGSLLVVRRSETAWRALLRNPAVADLMRSEGLKRVLKDNDVAHALSFSHYSELLSVPELMKAIDPAAVRSALTAMPVDDLVYYALGGTTVPDAPPRAEVIE